MRVATYEPWNMMNQVYKDVENTLSRLKYADADYSNVATSSWAPAVNIREDADQFQIEADIPGVDPKGIEVSMENGVLTIKGERKAEHSEDGNGYKRVERVYGSFYRRFSLPDTADAEQISANGKYGVLYITIPKKVAAQPRRIEVQVQAA